MISGRNVAIRNTQPNAAEDRTAILTDLLQRTSRTFALAIPCLPPPVRHEVTVSYLLFRITDTIEDATHLDAEEKIAALDNWAEVLDKLGGYTNPPDEGLAAQLPQLGFPRPPSNNSNYLDLLAELPLVVQTAATLRPAVREAIVGSLHTSLAGMRRFIAAGTPAGEVRITSLQELREYCYVVAGVVGELLTEVFVQGTNSLSGVRQELDALARWFGEGLQLVNILKDSEDDRRDGRMFIPREVTRPELFDLAREDLRKADAYVQALRKAQAPPGLVAFTELPLLLAWRTLETVEQFGPGSKVPRREVQRLLAQVVAGDSRRADSQVVAK